MKMLIRTDLTDHTNFKVLMYSYQLFVVLLKFYFSRDYLQRCAEAVMLEPEAHRSTRKTVFKCPLEKKNTTKRLNNIYCSGFLTKWATAEKRSKRITKLPF